MIRPRLHGPTIHGCRPGSPFLFQIAATGDGPLSYSADRLPRGLRLDSRSGLITGALRAPGRYVTALRVDGPGGHVERVLRIECGSRLALTPPMGWNSWNCWAETVDAGHVRASAHALVTTGLRARGWSHINIDDGWQGGRSGRERALQANDKFPEPASLCEELHSLGLRAGIYSSPWTTTYAGFPGGSSDDPRGKFLTPIPEKDWWHRRARFHAGRHSFAAADARQWAAWGFDYLKYDWFPNDLAATREMSAALRDCGRDIVYSLSNNLPISSVADTFPHAQLWRTTGDIRDVWNNSTPTTDGYQGVRDIIRHHAAFQRFQAPGAWNDPDMLVLGQVGWGEGFRPSRLTPSEQRTHFAVWCLWSAPLLIGCPLESLDPFTLGLLTHEELIDLDQDALGVQAMIHRETADELILCKPLENGDTAIGLINLSEKPREIGVAWKQLGLPGPVHVRDLWERRDIGVHRAKITAEVAPHDIAVFRLSREPAAS